MASFTVGLQLNHANPPLLSPTFVVRNALPVVPLTKQSLAPNGPYPSCNPEPNRKAAPTRPYPVHA